MRAYLEEFGKSGMKYKYCGIRLSGLKSLKEQNAKLVEVFGLSTTHYYIYHTDTDQSRLICDAK